MNKPYQCPFCKSLDVAVKVVAIETTDSSSIYAGFCNNCLATGPEKETEDRAGLAWNNTTGTRNRMDVIGLPDVTGA